jgi:hypothetical protein
MTKFFVFKPQMLARALERAGLSAKQLGARLPPGKVEEWLSGKKLPTIRQTELLARKLCVPFGFFCLNEPPEEKALLPDFRAGCAGAQRMSLGLRCTAEYAVFCRDFLQDYYRRGDCHAFPHAGRLNIRMNPEESGKVLEELLGECPPLPSGKLLSRLIARVEKLGIPVLVKGCAPGRRNLRLDAAEFRGMALCGRYVPLIFLNGNVPCREAALTLLQELCHILAGSEGISGGPDECTSEEEKFCTAAVLSFLLPAEGCGRTDGKEEKEAAAFLRGRKSAGRELLTRCALQAAYAGEINFQEACRITGLTSRQTDARAQKLRL